MWESLAGDLAGKVQVAKVDLEKNKKVSHRFRRKVREESTKSGCVFSWERKAREETATYYSFVSCAANL